MTIRLAPPPRSVPMSLAISNLLNAFAIAGWLVLGFSGIFVWVFVGNADFSFITFRGEIARATGEITSVEKTNASEGGGKGRSGTPIYANHYQYSVAGRRLTGVSYELGGGNRSSGEPVSVEYLSRNPESSRIAGMRRATFGPGVSFVLLFPLIGAGFLAGAMLHGLRRNALLRDGLVAEGKLIAKEATNTRINKQTVYALTFEYKARDGRVHQAKTRTHQPERLEDQQYEPLLYDPAKPSKVYLLDELPARPVVSPDGQLEGRLGRALLLLIVPLVVIVGHGLVIVSRLS